jgi:hypothetical protein
MKFIKILCFSLVFISLFFAVQTKAVAPNPITNLECVFSGMPEAVWLTWTPPAGAASYNVRYALSGISESDYNFTYQFSQNWQGSANSGLVDYLTSNRTWFFAMKSINVGGETSGISNVVWCFVPTTTTPTMTPPTSQITDPAEGATIAVGKDYVIKGQSADTGGSSVQEVEISLDGGKTWSLATQKERIGAGFTFEYLLINPVAGNYNIKTRATDWVGNIETPGAGIDVTVATQAPVVQPPGEQMTVEDLRAKITEIQQQIIQLLQELILLLQQQVAKF